ncbi:PLCH1 phosphodiesterase, partial [Campylorhamphus procurvoides]|nr:PLCH1 phosphodiesterase [Campylorhamphus procurvoides]
DTKEGGKKPHGRSLMGNFGKHKKAAKAAAKHHSASDEEESQQNPPGREPGHPHRLARRRRTVKLCRALSDLVVYTNSVAAQDLVDDGTGGHVPWSPGTARGLSAALSGARGLEQNQSPAGHCCTSRPSWRGEPVPFSYTRCMILALNYQSEGRVMQLNEAKFRVNGNCGYVLKPQQMCKGTFNPYSADPLPASPKKQLILKIISGQQLPKPPDSMLGDRGVAAAHFLLLCLMKTEGGTCSGPVSHPWCAVCFAGFNPVWEETLTFTIHMPEIALVRFLVWDHDPIGRDFVGQRTVAFSSLVPGYRHVYLEGLTEASIFVHIIINETYGKWSPLILNPSYTILHFLGATKSKQLMGLRGLFRTSPRQGCAEPSGHHVRKRSLGERLLRRTASAPAKGRKKSKMGLLEAADMRDSPSEPPEPRDREGVVRRPKRSVQARPASMPVDKYLLMGLPCPAQDTAQDTTAKENTAGKV